MNDLDVTPLWVRENADYDAAIRSIDATCERYFAEQRRQEIERAARQAKPIDELADLTATTGPASVVLCLLLFPLTLLRAATTGQLWEVSL